MRIKTTGSETQDISFLISEKSKTELTCKKINELISNRFDDTNVIEVNEKISKKTEQNSFSFASKTTTIISIIYKTPQN